MNLRHLDDVVLPKLARPLQAVADPIAAWFRRTPRPPATPDGPPRKPTGPAPFILRLRELDDRNGGRGPVALLREVPQVGALVVAMLLLVAGTTVKLRLDDPERENGGGDVLPGGTELTIGPTLGESVGSYIAAARVRLADRTGGQPDGEAYAVVSFDRSLTAAQAGQLLGGFEVAQVFYRVSPPPAQPPIRSAEVDDFGQVPEELARQARELNAEARRLLDQAKTITNDPEQKRTDEDEAARHKAEAKKLAGRCVCVVGAVIKAKLRRLLELTRVSGVRAVDAAPPRASRDLLLFRPLLPDEKITVTEGNEG